MQDNVRMESQLDTKDYHFPTRNGTVQMTLDLSPYTGNLREYLTNNDFPSARHMADFLRQTYQMKAVQEEVRESFSIKEFIGDTVLAFMKKA